MSLFNKIEVDPNIVPFIQRGEGVGIVKVDGYGKASARMESYKLILASYDDKHPIIESISSINYLSYYKGNFFKEPKLEIGVAHKKYILAGVENNDDELKSFYETLLDIKNIEKEQKMSSRTNKSRVESASGNVEKSQIENNKDAVKTSKLKQQLANNIQKEDSKSDAIEKQEKNVNMKDYVKSLEKNIDDDDDFYVLEEVVVEDEPVESKEEHTDSTLSESADENKEEIDDEKTQKENEIIKELNEVDDIIDEDIDLDRVINEEKSKEDKSEDTTTDKLNKPAEADEKKTSNESGAEKSEQPEESNKIELLDEPELLVELNSPVVENNEEPKVKIELEEEPTDDPEIKEKQQEEEPDESEIQEDESDESEIQEDDVSSEINQMKQEVFEDINSIQNEISSDNQNFTQYIPTQRQLDPVDQIRRYHELKEDGIITEEEFELKKKQLLDI